MATRRISIIIDMDLAKGSKEAHAVTIKRIADLIGSETVELVKSKGYRVDSAQVRTVMHYVRHEMSTMLVKKVVRRLKKVG